MLKVPEEGAANPLAEDCRWCPALVERLACLGERPGARRNLRGRGCPGARGQGADRWRGGNYAGLASTSAHAGRRIGRLLADLGFGREACYFANAVKILPGDRDGIIHEPTPAEQANCLPYLEREPQTVEPAVVLATGTHAVSTLVALADRQVERFLENEIDPRPLPGHDCPAPPSP